MHSLCAASFTTILAPLRGLSIYADGMLSMLIRSFIEATWHPAAKTHEKAG